MGILRLIFSATVFFLCSFSITSALYAFLLQSYGESRKVFGGLFRMLVYHDRHPYMYICIVCICYAVAAACLLPKISQQGKSKWLWILFVVLISPILASPIGGALWHYHDMTAGFFPPSALDKLASGIPHGLLSGWAIILTSYPYNMVCVIFGIVGTSFMAKILHRYSYHEQDNIFLYFSLSYLCVFAVMYSLLMCNTYIHLK